MVKEVTGSHLQDPHKLGLPGGRLGGMAVLIVNLLSTAAGQPLSENPGELWLAVLDPVSRHAYILHAS